MSAYEKFVERAAEAGHDAFFATERYDDQGELLPVGRQDVWRAVAEAVLAVVGPLIAEDTRDRMVAAAAVAVEREGGLEWEAVAVPCAACRAGRYGETVEVDLDQIPEETDRRYAFNGDEADDVWVDKP